MILLDAAQMTARREAHEYLKQMLAFPEYYGKNLDALYDCLTELDDTQIQFVNQEEAEGTYFDKILQVFREAEEDNSRLQILDADNIADSFQ